MKKHMAVVVGTRPNFIKITRFKEVAETYDNIQVSLIHTGQHFDEKMAGVFFQQLNIAPDHFLELKEVSPASQMGEMMIGLEKLIAQITPDILVVVGDVNSTLSAALVGNKLNIPLIHIESGLRSNDPGMPEEWNRIVTDTLSDDLFVTEESGLNNLLHSGKTKEQIHFVGNTMIDSLVKYDSQINESNIVSELQLIPQQYILLTIHRPATVDVAEGLKKLLEVLKVLSQKFTLVFPLHPRTRKKIISFGLEAEFFELPNVIWIDPLDYFSFQKLIKESKAVITDSGGIQEETTFRKIPCLTVRENTERPITITHGTNILVNFDADQLLNHIETIEDGSFKKGVVPELWDGFATERIMKVLCEKYLHA